MNNTLDILERLIAFPTVSANSNLPMIEWLCDYLSTRGFVIHKITDETGMKAGLFASIGPAIDGGILLSAHSDVVPVTGQNWTREPFKLTRDTDRVYGRGTTDMKGYLASVIALADKASHQNLKQPLKLAISYDEEIGCVGIKRMIQHLDRSIGKPAMCIVGEPTSMRIATGHKGKAAFKVICNGENGHSAMAPKFINALHVATDYITQIRNLQDEYAAKAPKNNGYDIPFSTLHIGQMSGGTALNIVPSFAEIDFEYRHIPEHEPIEIEKQLAKIANRINEDYSSIQISSVVVIEKINAYPGLNTPENCDVVSFVGNLAKSGDPICVPFGTEAGYFDGLGIPTVVCGPGSMDEQGHKPDENIALSQLRACDLMHDKLLDHLIS